MSVQPTNNNLPIGSEGRLLGSVSSTNDYLKNLINSCEIPHGYYVCSEYQTSGRGQVGNTWFADAGQNLLISVLFRPESLDAQEYFLLNMSVCLSILDMLNELHKGFLLKWPNDILFNGRKVAGVLMENTIAERNLQKAVVGIGINVNQREFPLNLNMPACSIRQVLGRSVDLNYIREQLLYRINQRFDLLLSNPQSIVDQYHQYLYGYKRNVKAVVDGRKGSVEIIEVGSNGLLHTKWNGQNRKFQFKEIGFLL